MPERVGEGASSEPRTYVVGQLLRHHAGDLWKVIEADLPGDDSWGTGEDAGMVVVAGDYRIECIAGREQGRKTRVHAEYLPRSFRVVEQQSGTEGERAFTDEDVQRGAAALVTARGVRGLFVDDWQRELAALAVLEAAYPRPPESPEHQPDDEATVEALREELAESAKREVGAKHRVNDLERALETERSRTVAAVVEVLREYGATVPAITVEVDDPLAVRTGSTTMPRSAADFIESHPRFKDGTGGQG